MSSRVQHQSFEPSRATAILTTDRTILSVNFQLGTRIDYHNLTTIPILVLRTRNLSGFVARNLS
ncbi:MAG: hypothetical protein MN733_10115, partial [Nitrososphaera sp.]|nr:hypothetical protein [Nitrososphaera sp.]